MRPPALFLVLALIAAAPVSAQPPAANQEPAGKNSDRETALEHLLSERESPEALRSAIEAARREGIGEQAILEARFLYHVDRREDDALAELAAVFTERKKTFVLADSEIFSTEEDWLAVTEYVQAIASLKAGDKDAFKRHITEAFWLSPRQGSAFAPHIERLRLQDAMRDLRLDLTAPFPPLDGGDALALDSLLTDKKALLLHFWSPWSSECLATLPDYLATSASLSLHGIACVSILPESDPGLLAETRDALRSSASTAAGTWLVDRKEGSLGGKLRIQSLPTFVLTDSEGRILFNGNPTEEELWAALRRIDAAIMRPATATFAEEP